MTVTTEIKPFSPEQARALKIGLAKEIARKRAKQANPPTTDTAPEALQDLGTRPK